MACNLLYSSEDKGNLGTHLRSSLRKGSLDAFKNWAKKMKTVPQSSRLIPNASDSDSDVTAARIALTRDLNSIIEEWFQTHPDTTLIQSDVRRELSEFFELTDSTQPVASDSDTESKTTIEVADKNSASLKAHMMEFYGPEAYNITADLRQNFEDLMTGIAYYDINSGTIADQTTEQLNQNIRTEKARLFRELVTYLKQAFPEDTEIQSLSDKMYQVSKADGEIIFDAHNYFKACNNFYTKVANTPDFRNVLQVANAERVAQTQRTDRTKKYEQLIKVLNADPDFKKSMLDKFGKSRKALVESQLYTADHYSPYYIAAKKYATTKNMADALTIIEEIERKDLDVLDAANAYTMLRHFDALVKDIYGDQISIKKNTAGYEDMIPDKYSYHFDSSHQVKSWQTTEDIGSERHTSKFTTAVINMIRVFDHKTGEYLHRRADNTSVIVAARNLINAVVTDNLRFRHETGAIRGTVEEFKENIILFHDDPVVRLQRILELLFEKPKNVVNATSLVDYIENRRGINDYDLSVLKSVYDVIFNKNSDLSFFKQARSKIASNQSITQNILEEVAGFVDRNVTAAYLETIYDFETGEVDVRAKKKYFNNLQLYKTQVNINNHVNGMSVDAGERLQTDYGFKVFSQSGDKFTHYSATIGGTTFTLDIPNALRGQILAKNLRSGTAMSFDNISKDAFDRLAKINLINFRDKFLHNPNLLTADEALLRDVLQFLDDTLNLGILSNPNLGLQTLYSYQSIYNPVDGMKNYLMPLVKLGLRAAYANQMYLNAAAAEQSLAKYLTESKNDIYKFHLGDKKSRLFSNRHKNLKFQIASYSDDVLGIWTDAQSILRGEASKATTKDKQGNSIPNNSVAKLGGNLRYYLGKQYGTPTGELLFAKNPDLIKGTYHDLEVTSMQDETKAIKAFSSSELFFHAIFNKFWGSYLKNNTVIIQPTEYSDKTTFLNWEINPTVNKIDLIRGTDNQTTEQLVIDHFLKTVGVTYQNIYDATVSKMQTIARQYLAEHPEVDVTTKYTDVLHLMSERELVNIASKLGLTVELNKDYRIIKDKTGKSVVGMNEMLGHNARLYNDAKALAKRFNEEKLLFLEQLMQNGASFQVLEGTDTLEMYTEDKISEYARSRNPVLNTILSYFSKTKDVDGRKQYMKDWVDANTGKLIFAKQNGTNIVSVADKYNHKGSIELNPLLDKFFYVESLMSNNLRYSLTGFEVNHATGKNSPFTRALKCQTIAEWNALPCANITEKDTKTWSQLHNEKKTGILDTVLDLNDLYDILQSGTLDNQPKVKQVLQSLLDTSYIYNTNTSQGTQFKRNVIIPATLQYCLQNTKEGVPPQIKCAVIRDEGAPVWNYRGDHEGEIDACDGAAWITPFQQRLENRSLGSQKVGNIRKPIWHSYDTESGTSYLAKFAVNTMTNQLMKRSLRSKAPLFNLFKKATNLQWDAADGIDLTKALLVSESRGGDGVNNSSYNAWFAQTILDGQQLFYEDKYGEVIEITGFNKDTLPNGQTIYYTLEKSRYGIKPARKYHIFYDITNPDGSIEKSVHETVSNAARAEARMAELQAAGNNPHTINSLFELHTALGGINCVDANGKGSEFNNDVVVNFMTNVGSAKEGTTNKDYVNQKTYNQPLKNYQIGYLLNNTAVKNGAKNINQSSAWTDNSDLTWFNVNSDGLGMQMNADHDVVDAELTEFSQVIAATAAYGYTYDNCSELYQGLAKTAFQASEATLKAVDNYLQNIAADQRGIATSELYDAVGRIIFVNQSIKDNESLTNIILDAVQKIFNKYKNHNLDEIKIPFSDSNLYSDFIATLASTINKQSIKRKHPGSGCPMAPGYNMMQYFELPDGKGGVSKVMLEDVLKRARNEYKAELTTFLRNSGTYDPTLNSVLIGKKTLYLGAMTFEELEQEALKAHKEDTPFSAYYTPTQDISLANQHILQEYLHRQQQLMPDSDVSYFMPSDIVEVLDANGEVIETIDLDSLDVYYNFKEEAKKAAERVVTNPIEDNGAVDFLMAHNKELASIGTAAEYREYLSSIFPESQLPTVYWHGTEADFTNGFESAQRTKGSGAPETGNEMYFAKQPHTVLQYIPGVNANVTSEEGYKVWTKLWWNLRQIMGNGQEGDAWKDTIIGPDTVRQQIPNKHGIYNEKQHHGTTLAKRKAEYGYQNKSDEEFFREVLDVDYGHESFNQWVARQEEKFKNLVGTQVTGLYPVLINTQNPIRESNQDTYYEEHRGLMTQAAKNNNDAILSNSALNEFGSDVAVVMNPAENVHWLGSAADVIGFKAWKQKHRLPMNARYRRSVTSPYNLRPSLIRWQYNAGTEEHPVIKYMNYFDLDHVKDAYLNNRDTNSPEYRRAVQDALNQLEAGSFKLNGIDTGIIAGTLENTEAELVMGNLYQGVFGIEGESLNEVLEQGEQYFLNKAGNLHEPNTEVHDFAFLRDNGKHVLVTIGNVTASNTITENPMDKGTMVTGDGEIYLMSGSRALFKIGRWANVNNVQYDADNQQFTDANNSILDSSQYRVLDNGQVQKRFDFVTRYDVVTPKGNSKNKVYQTNTLYKIADINTFKQALTPKAGQTQVSDADAIAQQAKIVSDIFGVADYKMIQINQRKAMSPAKRHAVENALGRVLEPGSKASLDVKNLLKAQLDAFNEDNKADPKIFNQLKKDFIEKEAHKKWISFQDSLKFIASRIPAQTLQSFMAMKLVGWTGDDSNIAYVSHFQTYLQGSDYDIDKAYIMGQNYDSNGVYVKWSPFFDFTSLQTLEASKQLPIAKNITVRQVNSNGADITSEITRMVADAQELVEDGVLSTAGSSEEQKVDFLNAFRDALKKIERANGRYIYNGDIDDNNMLKAILDTFNAHENYDVPANLAEAAFKNVASANIHAVSHDIRNRDQAYTAITMSMMRGAAEVSPKGEQASTLNMLNPLTKYIMQYQCIVGKNVIGITANGEKFWFNNYYYWTNVTQFGSDDDKKYLQFSVVLNRIKGRAKGTQFDPEQASVTINHIPDLDTRNPLIYKTLVKTFGINPNTEQYRYVDQMISQLLSAATDNAKELILAKINASTDFAKMYLILMTLGCEVNDIAAFMTSPLSEFVDSRTNVNMFQSTHGVINATNAINASEGRIYGKSFLHGAMILTDPDSDTGESVSISKVNVAAAAVRQAISENDSLYKAVTRQLDLGDDESLDRVGLDDVMQALILTVVENPRILGDGKDYSLLDHVNNYRDSEISNYLRYCQDLIIQLTDTKQKYTGLDKMDQLKADAAEFRKVFNLSNEMSGISAGYLGLNQGIPTSKLDQLKKINQMKRVVTDRERLLNISDKELFPDFSELKGEALTRAQDKQRVALQKVQETLKENNSWLDNDTINKALQEAHEHGIINNFDVIKMLTDPEYKLATKNYLHIIKGTTNVIDMMDHIPHYKEILNELKAVLVADRALSVKSRLINQLTEDSSSLTDQQLRGIIRFVDTLNIVDFLRDLKQPIFNVRNAEGAAGVVDGFNAFFDTVKVSAFDLSTQEGIAGFKHFVETEFYEYLRTHHKNNSLVRHLVKSTNDGMNILATDIDLLNPNVTTASKIAYDEILRGMVDFEKDSYNETYTIADVFQLYNLIVNKNQYGGDRFTTAFKALSAPNRVLEQYFKFLGNRDYDSLFLPEYNMIDFQINAAPLVSPSAERFHSEPFIKVKDPVWDYVVKKYNANTNTYESYELLPSLRQNGINDDTRDQRMINFAENCPFEMPNRFADLAIARTIGFKGQIVEGTPIFTQLVSALQNLNMSGKLLLLKVC